MGCCSMSSDPFNWMNLLMALIIINETRKLIITRRETVRGPMINRMYTHTHTHTRSHKHTHTCFIHARHVCNSHTQHMLCFSRIDMGFGCAFRSRRMHTRVSLALSHKHNAFTVTHTHTHTSITSRTHSFVHNGNRFEKVRADDVCLCAVYQNIQK